MHHGDPVQALLVLPPVRSGSFGGSGNKKKTKASKFDNLPLLVSAGGTTLKVWNPFNGKCLGTFATKHAKTITSLCLLDISHDDMSEVDGGDTELISQRKRHILTGGLDGLLRIHSASNEDISSGALPFLHGMQLTDPISALSISRDMSRLARGTTSGIVMVHQRRRLVAAKQPSAEEARRAEPRHGTYSYFTRGAHERSHDPDDYLLMHQKKQRLAEYDVLLRKFRYGEALDAVLAKRQPQAVIAVIEELGKRRGLTIALSNRDEESLDAILSFTIRFIDNPQYTPHLIGVAHILCDIYGSLRGQSAAVDDLFDKLRDKVTNECTVQRNLLRLLGQIDYVMTAAETLTAEDQR
jgi:U3 small nucleolar RNA-associated protein 15